MGKEADILAKIVVVEDDVYMREELLNLLEKSGYDTIGLSDFENAVSEIQNETKGFSMTSKILLGVMAGMGVLLVILLILLHRKNY